MFEVYGEFDSYVEINMAAEGLKEEGDLEGLREMAKENGLQDYVEDYISGIEAELCDVTTAAIGKLQVEKEEAEEWSFLAQDIVDYLCGHCDDRDFAAAVRKCGKRIKGAAERVAEEAEKHKITVEGMGSCRYCGPMKGYQLIKEYYIL